MSHSEMILRHMERFGSITALEAMQEYGIMRLGARIWDLRNAGHDITSELVAGQNRYGETTHFAVYTLHQTEKGSEKSVAG